MIIIINRETTTTSLFQSPLNQSPSNLTPHLSRPTRFAYLKMAAVISDVFLTNLANTLGAAAVVLIVAFQFVEISAKRENEEIIARGTPQPTTLD